MRLIMSLTFFMLLITGCARTIKVIPIPEDSDISLDGQVVGHGVTEIELPDEDSTYKVTVHGPAGYFGKFSMVKKNSPSTITISVDKDHSYFDTVEGNDIINKWIVIQVSKQYGDVEAWRKITSSVTNAMSDFEVLDQKSMYLKTAWRVAGKKGDYRRTRSRIIVTVDDPDPKNMTFKFKIESERIDTKGDVVEKLERTFQDFVDALETSRGRLKR